MLCLSSLLAVEALPSFASNTSSKTFAELVWGDNTVWSMVAPPSPTPHKGAPQAQEDFYEEAPQVPSAGLPISPQSDACEHLGFITGTNTTQCYHDHTLDTVPGDPGYRALWHVYLVVCFGNQPSFSSGSSSCTSQARTGQVAPGVTVTWYLASTVVVAGTTTPLTSGSAIDAAVSAGVVTLLDTGVTFICPVQAYTG